MTTVTSRGRTQATCVQAAGTIVLAMMMSFIMYYFSPSTESSLSLRFLHESEVEQIYSGDVGMSEEGVKEEEHEGFHDGRFGAEIDSATVVGIVLLLILMTIGFESLKEHLEHSVDSFMEPIVEKLFGEMTVLGFLSVFTFVVTKAGFFEYLSMMIYGENEREELLEVFESVHYCIFFVMVFFVLQVLILLRVAMQTEATWIKMNRVCREKSQQGDWDSQLPEDDKELWIFGALREEFILERSLEYPFAPSAPSNRVGNEFNFGRYLSFCLGQTLTHIVEVSNKTWRNFAVAAVLYWLLGFLVKEDTMILGICWVVVAWSVYFFNIVFESHLMKLREAFVARSRNSSINQGNGHHKDETLPLKDHSLPAWCHVDVEKYVNEERSWLSKVLVGGKPNRQQSLFWMDRKGPRLYFYLLQTNLVFTGLYCAVQVMLFLPTFWHRMTPLVFSAYMVVAAFPVVANSLKKKKIIAVLAQACSVGCYRRPQIVAKVVREDRTERIVRAFLVVYRLRRFANSVESDLPETADFEGNSGDTEFLASRSFERQEIEAVGKTFDAFDPNGNGSISREELQKLMLSLGSSMSAQEIKRIFDSLDDNGSGEISKEEFLRWYQRGQTTGHHNDPHEQAHFLFQMFDKDGSGEITIGEFKSKLDALNLGFSVDDAGAIVHELDEDGSGTIGLHEFEELIKKHYPKELMSSCSGHT